MSALCVHCDRDKPYHRLAAAVPDQFLACPVYVDGDFTGWHPVNRFKPRAAGEQFSTSEIESQAAQAGPALPRKAQVSQEAEECRVGGACPLCKGRRMLSSGHGWRPCPECSPYDLDAPSPATVQPPTQPAGGAGENQPLPTGNGDDVAALVKVDIETRIAKGVQTYGSRLKTNNGRNALTDAYQEALDLVLYLRQFMAEQQPCPRCAELERERDATWDALMETETVLPEPWFSVGAPSEFAKHIGKRLLALKAKLAAVERHMEHCRSVAGVPDDETLAVWIGEMKAKCERLEKAMRELLNHPSLPTTVRQIANAALVGTEGG